MFDWKAAEEVLDVISKEQLVRFLDGVDCDDIYGLGYFCDLLEGVMLVANGRRSFAESLGECGWRSGSTDYEVFRWDIGNWEYPAGVALSSTEEQIQFDEAWENLGSPRSGDDDDRDQKRLEELCIKVLRRLIDDNAFAAADHLEGFMILGPDDLPEDVLSKKKRLDALLNWRD